MGDEYLAELMDPKTPIERIWHICGDLFRGKDADRVVALYRETAPEWRNQLNRVHAKLTGKIVPARAEPPATQPPPPSTEPPDRSTLVGLLRPLVSEIRSRPKNSPTVVEESIKLWGDSMGVDDIYETLDPERAESLLNAAAEDDWAPIFSAVRNRLAGIEE